MSELSAADAANAMRDAIALVTAELHHWGAPAGSPAAEESYRGARLLALDVLRFRSDDHGDVRRYLDRIATTLEMLALLSGGLSRALAHARGITADEAWQTIATSMEVNVGQRFGNDERNPE